ncbi:hypothetical protein Fleli_0090 [Bernardetia litoralis DSM 6794]|uniref:Uncharacterized protein n=1 Tax=Bernardetia litoralis (strain ATCC 23117 / DSM 6794 / NBRC 15988 / NCIMB 1366 / Fx l1 / Sio-4) TaxID=880071 RepID=I4AF60_BERLS|nr:hypothetical protein [Bernardetia litoralis]AFM02595.1 hypothetical protein Fleli_0090 [Bernardetia litoralis DSM 6794]
MSFLKKIFSSKQKIKALPHDIAKERGVKKIVENDHLEPVKSIFSMMDWKKEYYIKLKEILFEGLSDSPLLRLQVFPSWGTESILQIEFDRKEKQHYLIYHESEKNISHLEEGETTEVYKYKKIIQDRDVKLVEKIFEAAIFQTRYSQSPSIMTDGMRYFFSVRYRVGQVTSPYEETNMGKLVRLGYSLMDLAKNENTDIILNESIMKSVEYLTKNLLDE